MFWHRQSGILEGLVDVKIMMTLCNHDTTRSQMTSKGWRRRRGYEHTLVSVVIMISISSIKRMNRDSVHLMMLLCERFHVPGRCWKNEVKEERLKILGGEGWLVISS